VVKFPDKMLGTILIVGGFSAFVGYTVLFNVRGRKAERALAKARGTQNATSFAEMFPTDAERVVAGTLYPRLEKLTFTRALPLSKEDQLFSALYTGSILFDEVTAHYLNFDDEDLWDDIVAVLTELCSDAPQTVIANELQGVETIGQLVTALAKLTSQTAIR
jgi:hypothetical protein